MVYQACSSQGWYTKVVFKTISVIPTLVWAGGLTVFIVFSLLLIATSFLLQKKFRHLSVWKKVERFSQGTEDIQALSSDKKPPINIWRKTLNIAISLLGVLLIMGGLTLAVWISRPYITILLSTAKIEALENKAKLGHVSGNRIIIPSALVDAPILEGVSQGQLSRGVCHVSRSSNPGEGGNCIIEGHNLAEFGWWKPQSFFSMLEIADKGTPIYVFYNGKRYIYKVREKTYKDITNPTLYDFSPGERLTLLTCVSTWSPTIYTNKRTVIVAHPQ